MRAAPSGDAMLVQFQTTGSRGVAMTESLHNKRERIAHLTSVHTYNDPRIFHKECRSLAQAGYDVYLVAPVKGRKFEHGVHVLPVGEWRSRVHRLLVIVPRVLRAALHLHASIYHLHDPELLLLAPWLRASGAEVVYDIHEDYITGLRQKRYLPAWLRPLLAQGIGLFERVFSFSCKRIIAERYYEARYPTALKILNYPILAPAPASKGDVVMDRKYRWYLYTGNVSWDRGALTQLRLLEANARAAICYVGNCRPEVGEALDTYLKTRGILPERLHVIGRDGYVSKEIIDRMTTGHEWIAGLALFPVTEHYCNKELTKFFEYMQAGLPILATDTQTWTDLIHDKVGFTIDIGDIDLLGQRSRELEEDADLRRRFAAQGREWVRNRFNWDREEAKLVDFYGKMLEPEELGV
jgi:glycosyltransferase involved in cell wall biosynthesis